MRFLRFARPCQTGSEQHQHTETHLVSLPNPNSEAFLLKLDEVEAYLLLPPLPPDGSGTALFRRPAMLPPPGLAYRKGIQVLTPEFCAAL